MDGQSPVSSQNHNSSAVTPLTASQFENSFVFDNLYESDNDINLNDLKNEQSVIDSTLKFLINYNVTKRKPGRPKSGETKQIPPVPSTVKESFKGITNVSDLHAGVLLDYLTKINKFNKILLEKVDHLNSKYSEVLEQLNTKSDSDDKQPANQQPPLPTSTIAGPVSERNNDEIIQTKIDIIEQNSYSNIILCSGNDISEITSRNDSTTDYKSKFVNKVKELLPDISNDSFVTVSPFGKDKKCLRITCSDIRIKNKILKEARIKKLQNIYYGEFLTSMRNSIFYKLRMLKKSFPDKLKTVYTRNGRIFYKLHGSDNFHYVKNMNDVTSLSSSFASD